MTNQSKMKRCTRSTNTNLGTPYPIRRGPRRGKHDVRGAPEHLRSINVHTAGAFYNNGHDHRLQYCDGVDMYIHYVDPENFTMTTLYQSLFNMRATFYLPGRIWYSRYGMPWPGALKAISSTADLHDMWADIEANGVKQAEVYTQDVIYQIPPQLPPLVGNPDIQGKHLLAMERQITDNKRLGAGGIGHEEMIGRRWYVTYEKKARGVNTKGMALRVLANRGYTRRCKTLWFNTMDEEVEIGEN